MRRNKQDYSITEEKYEKLGKEAKKLIEDAENEGELRKKQLIEEAKLKNSNCEMPPKFRDGTGRW